jgi:DNA-directed RNA polymerase II subunit RPB2
MEENTWTVLDSYFKSDPHFLTKHHLESFNDFIENKIQNTIKSLNPFITLKNDDATKKLKHEIRIYIGGENGDEIFFKPPEKNSKLLLPNLARLKNLTYKSDLFCNIHIKYISYDTEGNLENNVQKDFKNIKIGSIPIMLKSKLCMLYDQPKAILSEFGECIYDQGGYMIIDGKEKVIVAQERIATNRLFINRSKDPDFTFEGLIRCTIEEGAIFPKTVKLAVYSKEYLKGARKNAIVFSIPNINKEIPLFILFRALGVESDKHIIEYILHDLNDELNKSMLDFLFYSMYDGAFLYSQNDVLEYLSGYVKHSGNVDYVRYILMNDLFPNMNKQNDVSLHKKAMFLGHVAKHIIKVCLGLEKESDRDNYAFKRVDISGFLMGNLFRDFYNEFRNQCRSVVDSLYNYGSWKNDGNDIVEMINEFNKWQVFNSNIIDNGIVKSLKASWGLEKDPSKQGAVQDVNRISYIGYTSHMRRVNTPIDRSVKIVEPHRLHPTQWGSMCPCESPDGASIGLLKNLAMLCHITFDCSSKQILECLKELDVTLLEYVVPEQMTRETCKVLINSNWIGIIDRPYLLNKQLKLLRRNALINVSTSISWNIIDGEININTEAGRCCRPLYIIHEHKLLIQQKDIEYLKEGKKHWKDLIKGLTRNDFEFTDCTYYSPFKMESFKNMGREDVWKTLEKNQSCIEFIDVEESNTCMIAMNQTLLEDKLTKYTHMELHPSTIFAVLTTNIPFANHNQAPRNYFSGAQGKQAIGIYSTAFNHRMDTAAYVLHYPQRRIVNTKYMNYIGNNQMPNGENTIVAIMTYTGYNQEDSVIINKNAIDRGLFNLTYYKTIVESEDSDKFGYQKILFANPAELSKKGTLVEDFGRRFANYTKLDENGFPKENMKFEEGDVYLGKCVVKTEFVEDEKESRIFNTRKKTETYRDASSIADKTMAGTIDKVYVFSNDDGLKTCKIRYRKIRIPVLGDKVGSAHAQKGVVGLIIPQENMPYTKDGIIPDIIMNPHAIPTRMTIGHLMECVFAKLGCLEGNYYDATPFCHQNIDAVYDKLQDFGYERYGNEIMYNGITGEQMATDIFIGPTFYIRMKHMVADKINARSAEGGYMSLTRQPVKSRAKGGGLRIGEMETNTILSHGMSAFLKESLMERSDKYELFVENESGDIAVVNNKEGLVKGTDTISKIQIPYAAKTLLQELEFMSIMPRLVTDPNEFDNEEYVENIRLQIYDQEIDMLYNNDDEQEDKGSEEDESELRNRMEEEENDNMDYGGEDGFDDVDSNAGDDLDD